MTQKLLKLLKIPLFLFYYSKAKQEGGKENFGDILSLYLVKKISRRPVILINPSKYLFRNYIKHYFAIGSILSKANQKSIVWGTGIIRKNENVKSSRFLAVRGPKTRQRILELGYECDEVYGDPAILSPLYYKPMKETFDITGIIPHYVDYKDLKSHFKETQKIKVIDFLNSNVEEVIDEIRYCKRIISSSLHGVIVAHSYGIPAIWVKFSTKLVGDDIKFYDYFDSVSLCYDKEFFLKDCESIDYLFEENKEILLPSKKTISDIQDNLLKVCPFK